MRTSMVKLAAGLAVGACAIVGLSACQGSDGGSSAEGGKKISLLVSTLNNPFFVDLRDGAEAEAKAKGYTLDVLDAQNDAATQTNQANNAVSSKSNAVIINPVDSDAAKPGSEAIMNAKIPLIAVDRVVTGVETTSFVASDNVAGGKQAAEALAKAIGEKGEIIVLQGIPGASASRDRGQGFEEGIKAFPNIKVVAKQTANFDRAQALDVATNLLQANPNVKGIFAENDEMALGAVEALGARAGKEVKVVGFDGTEDGLKAVKEGRMAATVAQQPAELGKIAVDQAIAAIEGKAPEKKIGVPVKVVTVENVAEFLK